MEHNPLISVILPVYNTEKYVARCIESLIQQTCSDFEVLIVDDGSTDSSPEICDSYARADSRIRVYHIENSGVSGARNYALERVEGDFISFMDSDDMVSPHYLEYLYKALVEHNASIATCHSVHFSDDEEIGTIDLTNNYTLIRSKDYSFREPYRHYAVWGALYKKDVVSNLKFSPEYKVGEDTVFISEAIVRSTLIVDLDTKLYCYNQRDDSLFHKRYDQDYMTELDSRNRIVELFSHNSIWSRASARLLRAETAMRGLKTNLKTNGTSSPLNKVLIGYLRKDLVVVLLFAKDIKTRVSYLAAGLLPKLYMPLFMKLR